MEKKIRFNYAYSMEGHFAIHDVDAHFYRELPGIKQEYIGTNTGRPEIPRPDMMQLITVVGTTLLSSATLGSIIIEYLKSKRTEIKISIEGNDKRTVTYIGQNVKEDLSTIVATVDKLAQSSPNGSLRIEANLLPEKNSP